MVDEICPMSLYFLEASINICRFQLIMFLQSSKKNTIISLMWHFSMGYSWFIEGAACVKVNNVCKSIKKPNMLCQAQSLFPVEPKEQ